MQHPHRGRCCCMSTMPRDACQAYGIHNGAGIPYTPLSMHAKRTASAMMMNSTSMEHFTVLDKTGVWHPQTVQAVHFACCRELTPQGVLP